MGTALWNRWDERTESIMTLRNNSAFTLQDGVKQETYMSLIIRTSGLIAVETIALWPTLGIHNTRKSTSTKVQSAGTVAGASRPHRICSDGAQRHRCPGTCSPCPQVETGHQHPSRSAEKPIPGPEERAKLAGRLSRPHPRGPRPHVCVSDWLNIIHIEKSFQSLGSAVAFYPVPQEDQVEEG